MYLSHLSRTNQRIINALNIIDSNSVSEAIYLLLKEDQEKAEKLAFWFRKVAFNTSKKKVITENLAIMQMWIVGNVDIKEDQSNGKTIFSLPIHVLELLSLILRNCTFKLYRMIKKII